jgi:hypothetical protein
MALRSRGGNKSTGRFTIRRLVHRLTKREHRLINKHIPHKFIPENANILEKIAYNRKAGQYTKLIKGSEEKLIRAIGTAVLNARHNSAVSIPDDLKKYFKANEHIIAPLIKNGKSTAARRRILLSQRQRGTQRGGAFPLIPILLSAVLPVIGSAIGSVFEGRRNRSD